MRISDWSSDVCSSDLGQFRPAQQLLVNLPFLRGTEAIGNLDDIDAVNEGVVVLVVIEILPFGLVGVRHDDPGEGNSANILRTEIVALMRRGQQRVEHLDRRREHSDDYKKLQVRTIERREEG